MPTLVPKSPLFSIRLAACLFTLPFLATTNSLSAQSPTPADQPDRIHGTVLNTVTHEPIPRALVYSPDNRFGTLTDDRGRFELPLPQRDKNSSENTGPIDGFPRRQRANYMYRLEAPPTLIARKAGFLARHEGQDMVVVDPSQPEVVLALVPEARILGRISLPGSDGSDRVRVTLLRRNVRDFAEHWDPVRTGDARSDGEFRFAELSAGTYKLYTDELLDNDPVTSDPRGQVFGFPPVFFPSAADFDSSGTIHLAAGETFQATISLARHEYYPVRLPVVNSASAQLNQVLVWPVGHPGPGYSLGFDERQNAVRGSLPNGTYSVFVDTDGPAGVTGTATFTVRGAPVSGPSITLVPNSSISVVFREEFAHPRNPGDFDNSAGTAQAREAAVFRQNYPVQLVPEEPFGFGRQITFRQPTGPDDASLILENVPPGRYRVQVYVSSNQAYAASVTSGGVDLLHQSLVVGPGAAPPQMEITVRDNGGTVEGEVVNSTEGGEEHADTRFSGRFPQPVYFFPVSGNGRFATAWVSQNGQFQTNQLAPGSYRVLAFDRQQTDLEQEGEADLGPYESQSQVVEVLPGQKQNLRLQLVQEAE